MKTSDIINKILVVTVLASMLIGCQDGVCSKKIRTIVELTPKLMKESNDSIDVIPETIDSTVQNILKLPKYNITKSQIITPPTYSADILYCADNQGKVYAFSVNDRRLVWVKDISTIGQKDYIGGGVNFYNNKLYVTNGSRSVVVLNAHTGNELFRKQFPDIVRVKPILLNENVILVQTISNNLIAYDMLNAKIVWQHEVAFEPISSSTYVSPVIYKDYVIACYNSGQLVALDLKTGQEKWDVSLLDGNGMNLVSFEPTTLLSNLMVEDNYIYVVSSIGKIMKIDMLSGSVIWSRSAKDVQAISLNGNSLFIVNNAKQVAVASKMNGSITSVADIEVEDKKKKAVKFISPIISQTDNKVLLNIIGNNGKMYNFEIVNKEIIKHDSTINVPVNVEYGGVTPSGQLYLVTDNKVILGQ